MKPSATPIFIRSADFEHEIVVESLGKHVQCSVDLTSFVTLHVSYRSSAKLHQKAAPNGICIHARTNVIMLTQCVYANVKEPNMSPSVYNRPFLCVHNKLNAFTTVSGLAMHFEGYD